MVHSTEAPAPTSSDRIDSYSDRFLVIRTDFPIYTKIYNNSMKLVKKVGITEYQEAEQNNAAIHAF